MNLFQNQIYEEQKNEIPIYQVKTFDKIQRNDN